MVLLDCGLVLSVVVSGESNGRLTHTIELIRAEHH